MTQRESVLCGVLMCARPVTVREICDVMEVADEISVATMVDKLLTEGVFRRDGEYVGLARAVMPDDFRDK